MKLGYREVLGLDIGSSSAKMVQMHTNGNGCVVTAASIVEIQGSITDADNIRDIDTVNAINQCLKSTRTQSRYAVCGVCGQEVAVRYFEFPALPKEEVQSAVLLEASQVCPFDIDNSVTDYQLVPGEGDCLSGVLVAATNRVIAKKTTLAGNASLDCVLMDVDGLALLNCLGEYEKQDTHRPTAVLNVGNSVTNLAIINENELPFVRDITYAGNDIIRYIASKNNTEPEKVKSSLCATDQENGDRAKLMAEFSGACQKLIGEVSDTLRYYTAQEKAAAVKKILVCGGFALVDGFVELLSSHFQADVELWNPFDSIPCDADQTCKEMLEKKGPALAVAAGLAMRSI